MTDAVSERITVRADALTVMAIITDFEAYPTWQDDIKRADVVDQDRQGRGRTVRFVIDAGVLRATVVLGFDHGEDTLVWHLVEGEGVDRIDGSYRLEARQDGGTDVAYDLAVGLSFAIPGFIRRQAAKRIVDGALQGLKRRAEQPSRA